MERLLATMAGVVLSLTLSFSQMSFTVTGAAPQESKRLVVYDLGRNLALCNVSVADGRFIVRGNVEKESVLAFIDQEHRIQTFVIVDAHSLSVDLRNDDIQGSPLNLRFSKVVQGLTKIQKVYVDNHKAALTTTNKDSVAIYTSRALDARKREMEYYMSVFEANKDNTIGAFALSQSSKVLTYDDMKAIFKTGASCLKHPLVNGIRSTYESLELRHPGMKLADIEAYDVDGSKHALSEYVGKGNYVLVDFWASWCSSCMFEMPNVKNNFEKYRSKGFMVVGLSFDTKAEAWKKAIIDKGLDWVHLSDLKGWATKAAKTFGIKSVPSTILVDGNGTIVAVDLRGQQLGKKLKEIYGE